MKEFLVLVGAPNAGKSTFARQLARRGARHIEIDRLAPRTRTSSIYTPIRSTIENALKKHKRVIFDAVNIHPSHRQNLLMMIPPNIESIAVVFANPARKPTSLWERTARMMVRRWPPTTKEGFRSIISEQKARHIYRLEKPSRNPASPADRRAR